MINTMRYAEIARGRALLVDDDDGVRRSLQLLLHGRGYDVLAYASAAPVLSDERVRDAAVLVADYALPDRNGIELLADLYRQGWSGRSVLITAFPTPELAEKARATGYDVVLEKPLRQQALLAALAT